jgi:hypothetical protein
VQKGQLGTNGQRRVIFIWEGVVAQLPDKRAVRTMESLRQRLRRWDQAVSYWNINDHAIKAMWSISVRTTLRIDVIVTSRPREFGEAVGRLVERNNWPIRYVSAISAPALGRLLPTMADLDRVYYGLADQRWNFGPHGVFFHPSMGQIV